MRTIYTVVWTPERGTDTEAVARFRTVTAARYFASLHKLYQQPCTVTGERVPVALAKRWGVA